MSDRAVYPNTDSYRQGKSDLFNKQANDFDNI